MLVLDALFDHIRQISSNVEIIGNLVQCPAISAIDVREWDGPAVLPPCERADHFGAASSLL
jgi:hypothetical protein